LCSEVQGLTKKRARLKGPDSNIFGRELEAVHAAPPTYPSGPCAATRRAASVGARVRADTFGVAASNASIKRRGQANDRFADGGPHIGIGQKCSAPIGVGGGEIGATRNMGATITRRDGIIPLMIGGDTRRTLALLILNLEARYEGLFCGNRALSPNGNVRWFCSWFFGRALPRGDAR
jgi:hypothetical protein